MQDRPIEEPHWLDTKVTIIVCLAAAGFTLESMQGFDLTVLAVTYPTWPREPWRLLTSCLLHAGLLHLVFNLYWTWRFGRVLEPVLGALAMAGVYALLGAGSMAAQWGFSDAGIGLSGIGYGLFGLLWALDRTAPAFRGVMDRRTTELFAAWFAFCIVATVLDIMPVANVAHGVGALLGGLLGLSLPVSRRYRGLGRIGLAAALIAAGLSATVLRPYVNLGRNRPYELAYDAHAAIERGDLETAVELLEEAVARDPEFAHAWHNLGVAYYRLGRLEDASSALAREEELGATQLERADEERERGPDDPGP